MPYIRDTERTMSLLDRAVIGVLVFLAMLLVGIQAARATTNDLIPSVGMTRAVHGDNEVTPFAQIGLRTHWSPFAATELNVGYRQDHYNNGDLTVRTWPVTASLWLSPVPMLYAGGGVGWYNSSLDFKESLGLRNRTTQQFGTHVGGGLAVPLSPSLGLDLNAKYVFLEKTNTDVMSFDPSHWNTSAGIVFRF